MSFLSICSLERVLQIRTDRGQAPRTSPRTPPLPSSAQDRDTRPESTQLQLSPGLQDPPSTPPANTPPTPAQWLS